MVKFVVLSVEPLLEEQRPSARMKKSYNKSNQSQSIVESTRVVSKLAECVVARERDLGQNDIQFTCLTHLGPLLSAGDTVLGYDLSGTNFNVEEKLLANFEKQNDLPDVILVRKVSNVLERQQQPILIMYASFSATLKKENVIGN